jgi:HEAT repeat protein
MVERHHAPSAEKASGTAWRARVAAGVVRRIAGVRDGEGAVVARIAAVFALLEAGRALGENGINAILLVRAEGSLPGLFIPLGLVTMVVSIGFGAALSRVRRARLFGSTLVGIGALLLAGWAALAGGMDAVPVVWLAVMSAGLIAVTIAWTTAGSSLDARQAKRLFPLCTAAAIAGSFSGSLLAGVAAPQVGPATLIVAEAILFVMAAGVIVSLARRSAGAGWQARTTALGSVVGDVRVGFDEVRRSPLLSLIAVAYVLLGILLFSVGYPYLVAAKAVYPDEGELAGFLGQISALVTGVSFVVALVVANRVYARFGVASGALLLPIVYVAGFAVWIVRFNLATAAAVTVVQQVTQRGLSNAAWSAFYNVVPAARRAQVLSFMDGVPGQLGTVLSGILLLTAGQILAPQDVAWLGLAAGLACVVVVVGIRRRYAEALLRTLRSGIGEQLLEGGPGPGDMLAVPEVRTALVAALASPEAGTRSLAASMLARATGPEVRAALADALDDPDPTVASEAIVGVLTVGPEASDPAGGAGPTARAERRLAALIGGDEIERVLGLRAAHRLGRSLGDDLRESALTDPSPAVRAMAVAMLGDDDDPAATGTLLGALGDPSPTIRRAASTALSRRPHVQPAVLELLVSGTEDEQDAALRALEGHAAAAREPVLAWAERHVERAAQLYRSRMAVAGALDAPSESQQFLVAVLDGRIQRAQGRVLSAMAVLGAPAARGVIRRSLRSADAEIRAQAIEALDSVGDRRLGNALTKLLEAATEVPRLDADTAWRRLRDDDDPWISGLSRRIQASGADMSDPAPLTGEIETMLRLRRVPLFERLSPEDLQRLAAVATERWFDDGEALVHEGEPGDELFVILEGRVVVTRREDDGSTRRIRTYDAGDHIGELAVLRERPRAATVSAEGGRVRTLVIGGEGLTAILLERPEAAMAMLATLAERISVQ